MKMIIFFSAYDFINVVNWLLSYLYFGKFIFIYNFHQPKILPLRKDYGKIIIITYNEFIFYSFFYITFYFIFYTHYKFFYIKSNRGHGLPISMHFVIVLCLVYIFYP